MSTPSNMTSNQSHELVKRVARGLGWFSLALGAVELLRPRATASATGLRGRETVLQAYGAREIAAGIGLLTTNNPTPWLWARVAGDALDIATLGHGMAKGARLKSGLSLAAVIGVTVVDVLAARSLAAQAARRDRPVFDYSDRSGFPRGLPAAAEPATQVETMEPATS